MAQFQLLLDSKFNVCPTFLIEARDSNTIQARRALPKDWTMARIKA